ncbi:MAG TPA: hypothetical protein VFG84_03395 [Gemmatimonadaceae bacterium]|nr:hypothetical protein [Gemmatimonadaceae bacterium]
MPTISIRLFALAVFVSAAAPIGAQQSLPLVSGQRIRVSGERLVAPVIGSYQQLTADSLVVLGEGIGAQRIAISVSDIDRVESFDGFDRGDMGNVAKWGFGGAAAGAVAGFAVSLLLDATSKTAEYDHASNAAIGAVVGGVAGGIYGYRKVVEKWSTVPLGSRVGVIGGGRRLGLSIDF